MENFTCGITKNDMQSLEKSLSVIKDGQVYYTIIEDIKVIIEIKEEKLDSSILPKSSRKLKGSKSYIKLSCSYEGDKSISVMTNILTSLENTGYILPHTNSFSKKYIEVNSQGLVLPSKDDYLNSFERELSLYFNGLIPLYSSETINSVFDASNCSKIIDIISEGMDDTVLQIYTMFKSDKESSYLKEMAIVLEDRIIILHEVSKNKKIINKNIKKILNYAKEKEVLTMFNNIYWDEYFPI